MAATRTVWRTVITDQNRDGRHQLRELSLTILELNRDTRIEDDSETESDSPELRFILRGDGALEPIHCWINRRAPCFGWVQCYWCWRWRVTQCWQLNGENCAAWTKIRAGYWTRIEPTGALDHRWNPLDHIRCVMPSDPNWNQLDKNWTPLTRVFIDGRVYSPGLLGWLQCWRQEMRFTRCFVSNPLCDRCQALDEPPWYPNNKQRAVLYFQRVLRQQQDNIFEVHAEAIAAYLANAWEP